MMDRYASSVGEEYGKLFERRIDPKSGTVSDWSGIIPFNNKDGTSAKSYPQAIGNMMDNLRGQLKSGKVEDFETYKEYYRDVEGVVDYRDQQIKDKEAEIKQLETDIANETDGPKKDNDKNKLKELRKRQNKAGPRHQHTLNMWKEQRDRYKNEFESYGNRNKISGRVEEAIRNKGC